MGGAAPPPGRRDERGVARAKPGAPTAGERALATTKFASPDHRAVAAATIAARPAVYRIERITPGVDLERVPVFPSGPAVRKGRGDPGEGGGAGEGTPPAEL